MLMNGNFLRHLQLNYGLQPGLIRGLYLWAIFSYLPFEF